MDIPIIALTISIIALLISASTLWLSHLKPFELNVSCDSPRLSMYTIPPEVSGSEEGKTWWIPSFDIGMTFNNLGKRQGQVDDIRIVVTLNNHRAEKKFYFYPKWVVDYSKFNQYHTERFKWVKSAVLRDWYPFRLGADKEISLHLILESDRFDHKESGRLQLSLQISAEGSGNWDTINEYEMPLVEDIYDNENTFLPYNKSLEKLRKIT